MNSFAKNLMLWAAISLVMVVLFNLFNQPQGQSAKLSYSDFMILDEATSSIDSRTEKLVQQGMTFCFIQPYYRYEFSMN